MTQNIYDDALTGASGRIYDKAVDHITMVNLTLMRYPIDRRYIEIMRYKSTVAQVRTSSHRRRAG